MTQQRAAHPPSATTDESAELLSWATQHAPPLAAALPTALTQARLIVANNLAAALQREGFGGDVSLTTAHDVGFARAVLLQAHWRGEPLIDPGSLLAEHPALRGASDYHADVSNAVAHLGLTLARHASLGGPPHLELADYLATGASVANLLADQANLLGHNIHPLGRLRRGCSPSDALAYAAECQPSAPVMLRVVAVRKDCVLRSRAAGNNVQLDELLLADFPAIANELVQLRAPHKYALIPVHPWQYDNVLRHSFAEELSSGTIVVFTLRLAATPTTSMRTLVTTPGATGRCWAIKTALNMRLTSTRRDISAATIANGPRVSSALAAIVTADPWLRSRVSVVREVAGSCWHPARPETDPARARGLAALLREDLGRYVQPGQLAIRCSSLMSGPPSSPHQLLASIIDRLAQRRNCTIRAAARIFLTQYADYFATSALVLLSSYGVGLEGHLQNTVLVLDGDGAPARVLLSDFGGIRLHLPRLAAAGYQLHLHPDSITAHSQIDIVRTKAYYACLQANLAQLVLGLATDCQLPPDESWQLIWHQLEQAFDYLAHIPLSAKNAASDRAALLTPTAAQRAFVTPVLTPTRFSTGSSAGGEPYIEVPNPLHDTARVRNKLHSHDEQRQDP